MRIHRVRLTDFKGVEKCEIHFEDLGVTIVEGDNEIGKSSIMQAVDLLLGFRDDSRHQHVRDAQPVHRDVGAEVAAEISSGPYRFEYRKRWHRNKETELHVLEPSPEHATGREAHERVRAILAETLDESLWSALRIEQGAELSQGALADCHALSRALDAAAGGDAEDTDDTLWDRIVAERERYWTASGRPKGERTALADRVAGAREEVAELERHLAELDRDTADVERLTARLVELEADAERCVDEVAEHELRSAEVARVRSRADALEARHRTAVEEERRHREALSRRRDATRSLAELDAELAALVDRGEQDRPGSEAAERTHEELAHRVTEARARLAERRRAHERAVGDVDHLRQLIEVEQLGERLDRVRSAQRELEDADELLERARVDDELAQRIEEAHLERERARAVVDADAVRLRATALSDGVELVVDGAPVRLGEHQRHDISVADSVAVAVPGVVELTVQAGTDGRTRARLLEQASVELEDLLAGAGVADHLEARRAAHERREALRRRDDARRGIAQDLRDLTSDSLAGKVDRLNAQVAAFRAERSSEPPLPPDLDAATAIAAELRAELDREERDLAALESELDATTARLEAARQERAGRSARIEMLAERVAESRRRLEAERADAADDDLERACGDAARRRAAAQEELEEVRAELEAADPGTVSALLDNACAALERVRRDAEGCRSDRDKLLARVEYAVERGPSGDLDEARTRLDRVEREHERLESRARAAELLFTTMSQRRDEARSRYHAPLRERIERLGRLVYGSDFSVELDDDLSIARRSLDGVTLDVDLLSVGAKEQLGILSRLACASLVAPEDGAPVVIDDALGWTDPARVRSMGAALATAGRDCQVIVLTCTPGRYSAVGNATVVRLPT